MLAAAANMLRRRGSARPASVAPLVLLLSLVVLSTTAGLAQTCGCAGCTGTQSVAAGSTWLVSTASTPCSAGQYAVFATIRVQSTDQSTFTLITNNPGDAPSVFYPSGSSTTAVTCFNNAAGDVGSSGHTSIQTTVTCQNSFFSCPLTWDITYACRTAPTPSSTGAGGGSRVSSSSSSSGSSMRSSSSSSSSTGPSSTPVVVADSAISWDGRSYGDGQCAAGCGVNGELCPNTGSGLLVLSFSKSQCPDGQVLQLSHFRIQATSSNTFFRLLTNQAPAILSQVNDSLTCLRLGDNSVITATLGKNLGLNAVCDSYVPSAVAPPCEYRWNGQFSCVAPISVPQTFDWCAGSQCGTALAPALAFGTSAVLAAAMATFAAAMQVVY